MALLLEYEGGAYHGSQLQKGDPSIQETLETAIEKLTGERPRAAFAGRTDAGVHAHGQVAAFDTTSTLETSVFETGLNAWLPKDIAVRRAREVDAAFDPRRHATARTYRYTIHNARLRSPLTRAHAWHVPGTLDIEAMREAAAALVGEHDFASFTRDEGVSTVRCVRRCDIVRDTPVVVVEMTANAFLRHQVRRTVGALVEVGSGKLTPSAFRGLLEKPEFATAGP
ncbi:MAG: tRNA pseudouridine(38-40) synthase TruA, partial [Chloroflexi bacterium]|nr:tRNA pseudouridine(38-40) synthase TruA [Chloroflexota bacterium]